MYSLRWAASDEAVEEAWLGGIVRFGGFDGWKQAGYPLLDYIEDSELPSPALISPAPPLNAA